MDGRATVLGLVEMVDWNINFGNMLTIGVIVGGWAYTIIQMRTDVKDIKTKMEQVAALVTNHAVFENRLENVEEDVRNVTRAVEELRRGDGWIQGGGRRGVDGEYP
jgi:hypothetical protein